MHDINPLGTVMHLKELDRWAAPKLRPLRSKGERSFRVAALATASVAFVLHAIAIPFARRVALRSRRTGASPVAR